jgi:hypothetical protein
MGDVAFVLAIPHPVRTLQGQGLGDPTGGLEIRDAVIQASDLVYGVLNAERRETCPCRDPAVASSQT